MDTNFNWKFYLYANPDLKKSNIITKELAVNHFLKHGQFENRKFKIEEKIDDFDNNIYYIFNKNKYNNLNNPDESFFHYILYSPKENIIYNYENAIKLFNFNWIKYLYLNQDLLKSIFNKKDAFIHFIKYGIVEKRNHTCEKYLKLKLNFNWELYILLYNDLKHIKNHNNALTHFITNGIDENRIYNIIINNMFYKINKEKYNKQYDICYIENIHIKNKKVDEKYLVNDNKYEDKNNEIKDNNDEEEEKDYEQKLFYFKHWNEIGKFKKKIFYNQLNKNQINSNFGIAISLYMDDNTPKERIMSSYICLNSIVMHFIENKIILLIDYNINSKFLKFVNKLALEYKNIEVFKNNENFGIAKTKNICLKLLKKYDYLDYFCLLDDDIEIIDNFELYIKEIYEKTKIPIISNFNYELNFEKILCNNISLIYTEKYFGNILIIHKDELIKKGYFNKFEYKWGSEHIEITKRYLYNTEYKNIAIDFRAYFNNSQIINNINTLHLHSSNINHSLAKKNKKLLNKYLKQNIYVDFILNENEITKLF